MGHFLYGNAELCYDDHKQNRTEQFTIPSSSGPIGVGLGIPQE